MQMTTTVVMLHSISSQCTKLLKTLSMYMTAIAKEAITVMAASRCVFLLVPLGMAVIVCWHVE